jgi:hypothetical protein
MTGRLLVLDIVPYYKFPVPSSDVREKTKTRPSEIGATLETRFYNVSSVGKTG